ncbi:unnamed protein product, partial [marine sediment metagenome]
MPSFDPVQTNFSAGEVSPTVLGNFELEKYKQGSQRLDNFICKAQGGVERRGGFKYVAEVKDSAKTTILQEFRYKNEFFYILEFGDLYIRFYTSRAQIISGTPVEVATPYAHTEVTDLRFAQDEDSLYIVHINHPPMQLTRTSDTVWSLEYFKGTFAYDYEWIGRSASQANAWMGICWSPKLNLFVAVSEGGTNRVMTSPDGITWTNRTAAAAVGWA